MRPIRRHPGSSKGKDLPRHLAVRRIAFAAAVGVAGAGVAGWFLAWQATVVIGWSAAASGFLLRVWTSVLAYDAAATEAHAGREDDSRVVADLTLLVACVASLVGVGLILVKAAQTSGGPKTALTGVGGLSVVLAWAVVHTVYALRYGRLYYVGGPPDEPAIGFAGNHRPTYRDFAYVAFTIGMTYQVSDTELRSQAIRSAALRHALLSYLFGTAVIALTINVVAGLVK